MSLRELPSHGGRWPQVAAGRSGEVPGMVDDLHAKMTEFKGRGEAGWGGRD